MSETDLIRINTTEKTKLLKYQSFLQFKKGEVVTMADVIKEVCEKYIEPKLKDANIETNVEA